MWMNILSQCIFKTDNNNNKKKLKMKKKNNSKKIWGKNVEEKSY